MTAHEDGFPVIRGVSLPYKLTFLLAGLLSVSSVAGLLFGPRGWYDNGAATFPALLSQDLITLILIVPTVLASAIVASRGSIRGLLCWMGALLYTSYFYYFNLLGIRFNPLFPVYIGIVSLSTYSLLALLFATDPEQIKASFGVRTPTRMVAGFLISLSLAFATIWAVLISSDLLAGRELATVTRLVVAIDGVLLLPLSFFAGLWLWRGFALGYALSCLLLIDFALTFLTLAVTTLVSAMWGQRVDPLLSLYVAGLFGSVFLLVRTLQSIKNPNSNQEGVEELFSGATAVGPDQLRTRWDTLPAPVRRYLGYAIQEGAPAIRTARLIHVGTFRTKPNQRWLAIEGAQHFTVGTPGFIWTATVRPMPLISIQARDSLIVGHGRMLVKLMSLLTIADARGPEIDQGSRLRWLAECAWFPYAFVGDSIEWQAIDDRSARAKLRCDGLPVVAVFEFDEEGKLRRLQAERYRDMAGAKAVLAPWRGEYSNYREFGGFRVPTSVDVSWKLEAGSFSYARFEITTLEYR